MRWARDANHRVAGNHGGWVGLEEKVSLRNEVVCPEK